AMATARINGITMACDDWGGGPDVLLLVGDQPKTLPMFTDRPPLMIGGVAISYQLLWIVGCSLAVVGLLALFFRTTRTGKAMRAVAIDREAAALQGIPVSRM
ncbi:hypothetical protein ACE4Z5_24660, partial [Salmonella enterica]|uniref:ABC transporter permease subunit n=1 Tax=Salmonella enterica TaxID=28901 RepID=UPI003D2C1C4C